MKRWSIVFLLAGLAAITVMVLHEGLGEVLKVLSVAGWGLLWLVPLHLLPVACDGLAWLLLLKPNDPQNRINLPFMIWACSVREAVGRLLPISSLAGDVVGVHIARQRLPSGPVIASVVAEIFMTLCNQYIFSLVGIALLVTITGAVGEARTVMLGLLFSLPIPILFGLTLHYGSMFHRLEGFLERAVGPEIAAMIDGRTLDREMRAIFFRSGRLIHATLWQLIGFTIGALETWVALWLLGHPLDFGAAVAIESIALAIRNLVFFVPGTVGVQEAGIMLFGHMLGLDSSTSLSLSLAKRMRELVYGAPVLVVWQWQEARRLRGTLRKKRSA